MDGVDGVQAQGVDVEVPQPAQRGVNDEGPHLVAAGLVVVDGLAPGGAVGVGEVGAEGPQVVPGGSQVVVDHVQAHPEPVGVGGVHQAGQRLRAAVGLVDGPQVHPVVAPASSAGEARQGHELDHVHPQLGQVGQALDDAVERAGGSEGAHVELVDDASHQLPARPAGVGPQGPVPGGGVDHLGGAVHALGLEGAARVGQGRAVVGAQQVAGPVIQVVGGHPPARVRGRGEHVHLLGGLLPDHHQPHPAGRRRPDGHAGPHRERRAGGGAIAPVTLLVVPGGRCRGLGQLLWA